MILQPSNELPEYVEVDELIRELWLRGELEFLLWPQQEAIWALLQNLPSDVIEFVILCARQFGKSTLGVLYALSEAIKNRDCCILIMGPDIQQTTDIVGPKMRFLTRTAPPGLIKPMAARNRYHVYHDLNPYAQDYTEIVIGGFNENSSSQRGKTVHRILVEEIVDVPEDQFLTAIRSDLGPALTHAKDGKIVYLTTLPKYPSHPFITQTMVQARLENAFACYTIDDNIALTPQQKANSIKLAGGIDSADCKRELYCQVVRDPRVVCLPSYDPLICVKDFNLPNRRRMTVTIDWGGVKDKTVAALHTYDYLLNKKLFWDERVHDPNTPTSVIMHSVFEMIGDELIFARWVDAPGQMLIDLADDYGFHSALPQKDDWRAALNNLNHQMGKGMIWIHPRCKFLQLSAESGILNNNRTDFDRNEALGHMDGVACMMYAVRMQDCESPYEDNITAIECLQGNAMPSRSVYSAQRPMIEEPVLPKAFGRFRK